MKAYAVHAYLNPTYDTATTLLPGTTLGTSYQVLVGSTRTYGTRLANFLIHTATTALLSTVRIYGGETMLTCLQKLVCPSFSLVPSVFKSFCQVIVP